MGYWRASGKFVVFKAKAIVLATGRKISALIHIGLRPCLTTSTTRSPSFTARWTAAMTSSYPPPPVADVVEETEVVTIGADGPIEEVFDFFRLGRRQRRAASVPEGLHFGRKSCRRFRMLSSAARRVSPDPELP